MNHFFLFASILLENRVEVYSKPLVRLNGVEQIIDLDESELKTQIIGMKEGEVQTLFIESKPIKVEIIKTDATYEIHTASSKEDAIPKNLF